jgi:hypothetical protein
MHSDPLQVLADAGPFGPGTAGHSHSDTLSIVARDGGEEILVDAGTYTYVSDPELRNWFRGSIAHNTLKVDGRDQALAAAPFRWIGKPEVEILEWTSTHERDLLDAVCRYGGLTHRRRTLMLRNGSLIICDTLNGAPGLHIVEQFWHPGEPIVRVTGQHCRIGTRSHLRIAAGNQFELVEGWRSKAFGEKSSAPLLVVRGEFTLPTALWTVLSVGDGVTGLTLSGPHNEAMVEFADHSKLIVNFDLPGYLRGGSGSPTATSRT